MFLLQAMRPAMHKKATYEPHSASTHLKAITQAGLPHQSPPDVRRNKILSFPLLSVKSSLSHLQGTLLRPSIIEKILALVTLAILMHRELKHKRQRERSYIHLS